MKKVFNLHVEVEQGCVTCVYLAERNNNDAPTIRITDTAGLANRILHCMGYMNSADIKIHKEWVQDWLNESNGYPERADGRPQFSYDLFSSEKTLTFFVNPYNEGDEDRFAADSQSLMQTIIEIMEQLGECRHISDGLYGYTFQLPSEEEGLTEEQKKKIQDEVMEKVNEVLILNGIIEPSEEYIDKLHREIYDNYEGSMDEYDDDCW